MVVGGGVVEGGGFSLHWTPAASVLSQSLMPHPSNLLIGLSLGIPMDLIEQIKEWLGVELSMIKRVRIVQLCLTVT